VFVVHADLILLSYLILFMFYMVDEKVIECKFLLPVLNYFIKQDIYLLIFV